MSTRSAAQGGFPQVPRLDTDVVKVCKQFYACWSGFRVAPRMTAILYHLATLAGVSEENRRFLTGKNSHGRYNFYNARMDLIFGVCRHQLKYFRSP